MTEPRLYGGPSDRRVTIRDLQAAKVRGERWPMLTAYDVTSAEIFDAAGIPVLLVGDSAANVVFGYDSTLPVTMDEMVPLVRAVSRGAHRALVVADMPFGSYQAGPADALADAARFMKEGRAHAVKLEGGARVVPQVSALVTAGVPVMGHVGLTPQSVNVFGGYRVQGRGDAAELLMADALALQEAGAFAVVLEVVPRDVAARVTEFLEIPTIGIGAGTACDAQVLVWQDMAGMRPPPYPKFVKPYADLHGTLTDAARRFAKDVASGAYPDDAHSYE
jgi:3-methyl-2-oxobutanoate hydroxymethyltransferase